MGNHWHFVAWPGEEQSRWELSLSRSRPFGDDGWMDQTVKNWNWNTQCVVRAKTNMGKKVQSAKNH